MSEVKLDPMTKQALVKNLKEVTGMDEVKLDPEVELVLIRNIVNNIINMAEGVKCTIMDFAAVAVEAYKVLDPFLKARDVYLDEFIQSSDKDVVKIMLVLEEELLDKWAKYLNKEVMRKALLNPYFDNEIDVILVSKADTTSVKFNQIDVGIRVQCDTNIPDDDYYAIGIETEESFYPDKDGYPGVPFVNIYYNPKVLATDK